MNLRNGRDLRLPILLLCSSLTLATGCQKPATKAQEAPAKVLYTLPVAEEITDFEQFTGRTDAVQTVEVRARVTGYLDKVHFEDGNEVEKGALLFDIDPRPYEAEAHRADATLEQAVAKDKRLDLDFKRNSALLSKGTVSREEYDRTVGDLAEARAAVGIAEAQVELAKLDLDFTKVHAPISGRLSRRMVDPGNLVKADETMLTTIVSLDPIYVYFDIDERTILRIRRLIREGKVKSRTEAEVPILAGLADEPDFPHQGTIDFSENKIDPNTGTLRVRGVLKNPTPRVLSPGMFLRVRLPIGKPHPAVMVAEQAVGTDQGKKFVYVINDKDVVEARPVTVGILTDRSMRVIEDGLKLGEKVVVSGLQRIRSGKKVEAMSFDEAKAKSEAKARTAAKAKSDAASEHSDSDSEPRAIATSRPVPPATPPSTKPAS